MDRIGLTAEISPSSLDAAWEPRKNKNVRAAWLFATLTDWVITAKNISLLCSLELSKFCETNLQDEHS